MKTIQVRRSSTRRVTRRPSSVSRPYWLGQQVQGGDGHLRAEVFARVMQAVEEDLRLALVGARLVGHLGRPELAALEALADGEEPHDVRVRGRDLLDVLDHLRVRVVARIACGVVGRRGLRGEAGRQRGQQEGGDGRTESAHSNARCYALGAEWPVHRW